MRGKVVATGLLVASMSLGLVACGTADDGTEGATEGTKSTVVAKKPDRTVDIDKFDTFIDVVVSDMKQEETAFDEERYVYIGSNEGKWYRIEMGLKDGMYDILSDLTEREAEQKQIDIFVSTLELTKKEDLGAPSQEELDGLAGKKGSELASDGYEFQKGSLAVNGNETDCNATKGNFVYLITFDGAVPDEGAEDVAGAVADLPVKYVGIQGVTQDVIGIGEE